jgi:hypothetical protein
LAADGSEEQKRKERKKQRKSNKLEEARAFLLSSYLALKALPLHLRYHLYIIMASHLIFILSMLQTPIAAKRGWGEEEG